MGKMKGTPRYCVISMRVTEEEKAQATEQAKKEKVSVDWLLREAAVNRGLFAEDKS